MDVVPRGRGGHRRGAQSESFFMGNMLNLDTSETVWMPTIETKF